MLPFIFQHNNAPVHTARNVYTWLDEHDVQVIQCPAQSPDLNVIKNGWCILQNRVMRGRHSTTLERIECMCRACGGRYYVRLSAQAVQLYAPMT